MLRVELLPAGYGDAILVSYGKGDEAEHHLLIDAGQASTAGPLLERLERVRAKGGRIDLFVVTHIDNDHVGGALKLLRDPASAGMIDGIWFNGYVHLDQAAGLLGPIQGEQLTKQIVDLELPWNNTWPRKVDPARRIGGPVVIAKPTRMRLPGGASALVLSPAAAQLAALRPVWEKVVTAAGLRPDQPGEEEPEVLAPGLLGGSLELPLTLGQVLLGGESRLHLGVGAEEETGIVRRTLADLGLRELDAGTQAAALKERLHEVADDVPDREVAVEEIGELVTGGTGASGE